MRAFGILAAASLLAACPAPSQVHLYVDAANGNDQNPGTRAQPLRSITRGVAVGQQDAAIHVLPGLYSAAATGEQFPINLSSSHQRVRLLGLAAAACTVDLGAAAALGFRFQLGAKDVEIAGLTIQNSLSPNPGWYDMAISIGVYNSPSGNPDVEIHHCVFRRVNRGIFVWGDGSHNVRIHDNLFLETMNDGVNVHGLGRVFVYNNVFARGLRHGIVTQGQNGTVANNIVIQYVNGIEVGTSSPGNLFAANCVFGCTGRGFIPSTFQVPQSNLQVDPLLQDPAKDDYHLKAGSPCLEAGHPVPMPTMVNDFYGGARVVDADEDWRAVPDIGVHEANDLALSLQSGWTLGGSPQFRVDGPAAKAYLGMFFLSYRSAAYVFDPVGSFGLDPTGILLALPCSVPGTVGFAIPNDPLLAGAQVWTQAVGVRNIGGTPHLRPTGRLELGL